VRWVIEETDDFGMDRSVDAEYGSLSTAEFFILPVIVTAIGQV
jgi:hypothetical protein